MTKHSIRARGIVRGRITAPALVSNSSISFLGDVDLATGDIIAASHELHGNNISGKILIYPESKGSSGGCIVLMSLAKVGRQPLGIVLKKAADPNIVEGAILSGIALLCEPDEDILKLIPNGAVVTVDGQTGEISWEC